MCASMSISEAEPSIMTRQSLADVGVLFVHGIGRHESGSTLQHMGGSLAAYTQQRYSLDPTAVLRMDTQAGADGEIKEALDLTIRTSSGAASVLRLREARWEGSFEDPTIGEVVRWGLVVAPWVLHREAFRWWWRRGPLRVRQIYWRVQWNLFASLSRFFGFTIAAIALQVFILLSLSLVWIRPVRRVLDTILVRTVGDAYRFVGDPNALTAMSMLVAEELRRLSGTCRKVMIVAHSQGAAVARSALELQSPPPNFERLITLGAGLAKLYALQDLRHRSAFLTYWTIMRFLLIFVILLTLGGTEESVYADLSGVAGLLLVFAPMRGVARSQLRMERRIEATPGLGQDWTWLDLWSTRDLVPDGLLRAGRLGAEGVVISLPVDNSGSWISDHVTYLSNPGQVLPLIYGVAAQLSGLNDSALLSHTNWLWRHRRRRARARGRGRLVAPIVGVILALPIDLLVLVARGDRDWAGLFVMIGGVSFALMWPRLWRRWEKRCRQLEPLGKTVPVNWVQLMRPSFWRRLPAVTCPPDFTTRSDREWASVLRRAIIGTPLSNEAPKDEEVKRLRHSPHSTRLVVVIFVALAALAGLAVLAFPFVLDTIEILSNSEQGTSRTALIVCTLLDPWPVSFAVGTIVLPGIVLDALGELSAVGLRQSSMRRLSVVSLIAALCIASIGVGTGIIILVTVRPTETFASDCFGGRPTDASGPSELHEQGVRLRRPLSPAHRSSLAASRISASSLPPPRPQTYSFESEYQSESWVVLVRQETGLQLDSLQAKFLELQISV